MADAILALPYPQRLVEQGGLRADALISVTGVGDPPAAIDPAAFGGRVLRLAFDDIPNDAWTDRHGKRWRGPAEQQLADALAFARAAAASVAGPVAHVAVHCKQGKSRSASLALAIMADRLGPGGEAEAVRRILDVEHGARFHGEHAIAAVRAALGAEQASQICFNPGLVRMADRLLGRGGAIEAALEAQCPPFRSWRAFWVRENCLSASP